MKDTKKIMAAGIAAALCLLLFAGCAQKQEPERDFIIPDTSGQTQAPAPDPSPAASAEPSESPSASPSLPGETLKLEMEGDEVKAMQQRLSELGYLDADSVTGYFGTTTEAAVKKFQENNGLEADGIAGSGTMQAMMSAEAVAAG